jgi:hypothetical protein
MQVLDDVQLSQAAMGDLAVNELLGDDADGTSTRVEHGVGELAHKTDVAAAVDQGDPALGKQLTKPTGGRSVGRRATAGRTTEDTDHRLNSISVMS